jgi:hypothetical protein
MTTQSEIAEIENKIPDIAAPPMIEESMTYYPADSCKGLDYSRWIQVAPCSCRTCKEERGELSTENGKDGE